MRRTLLAIASVALLLAACSSAEDASAPGPSPTPTPTPTCSDPATVSGAAGQKPTITIPNCTPPTTLQKVDITTGSGKAATASSTITINYLGVSWSTGKQFDASWDRGQPATFPLGNLIPGWIQGIPGMKIGGRRVLTIPPDLGYGTRGSPPDIAPNETLVFVIDLIAVQ